MENTNSLIEVKIRIRDQDQEQDQEQEFRNYIIETNIALQDRLQKLISETKDLQAINQECENQLDLYDSRLEYMRRLLQNLEHLRHLYIKLAFGTDDRTDILADSIKTLKIKYYEIMVGIFIINLLVSFNPITTSIDTRPNDSTLYIYYWFNRLFQLFYVVLVIYCIYETYTRYRLIETLKRETNKSLNRQSQTITEIKNEIKTLEDTSLSLQNWLDEI